MYLIAIKSINYPELSVVFRMKYLIIRLDNGWAFEEEYHHEFPRFKDKKSLNNFGLSCDMFSTTYKNSYFKNFKSGSA